MGSNFSLIVVRILNKSKRSRKPNAKIEPTDKEKYQVMETSEDLRSSRSISIVDSAMSSDDEFATCKKITTGTSNHNFYKFRSQKKVIQTSRNRAVFVRQDSFDDTASEGYSSRKCSDDIQYESLSKNCRAISDYRTESISIPGSLTPIMSQSLSSEQNSIEDSNSLSSVWKAANMKIVGVPKDKQNSKQGRSNSDISVLGKSLLKSSMTKRRSQT